MSKRMRGASSGMFPGSPGRCAAGAPGGDTRGAENGGTSTHSTVETHGGLSAVKGPKGSSPPSTLWALSGIPGQGPPPHTGNRGASLPAHPPGSGEMYGRKARREPAVYLQPASGQRHPGDLSRNWARELGWGSRAQQGCTTPQEPCATSLGEPLGGEAGGRHVPGGPGAHPWCTAPPPSLRPLRLSCHPTSATPLPSWRRTGPPLTWRYHAAVL